MSDDGETLRDPIPSKDFWFDDGNVILIAGESSFRIHRSVLSQNSSVLRQLLDLPRPSGSALMDGCPVIYLPESAHHIGALLGALYGKTYAIRRFRYTHTRFTDPNSYCIALLDGKRKMKTSSPCSSPHISIKLNGSSTRHARSFPGVTPIDCLSSIRSGGTAKTAYASQSST